MIDTTSFSYLTIVAIDVYTINGISYTVSDVYQQILTNVAGCDSVLIIDLTIETTGMDEETHSAFVVLPNPTFGFLQLKGLNNLGEIRSIKVVDAKGAIVLNYSGPVTIIDLERFSEGLYYLRIEHSFGIETIKFVRQ